MYDVFMVRDSDIVRLWPEIKGWIDAAIHYGNGRFSEASILFDLAQNQETLWLVTDGEKPVGCFTIRINEYPHRKMAMVKIGGGEGLEAWYLDVATAVIDYAEDQGCDGVEAHGRDGWWKFMKKLGFQRRAIYELNL